MSGYANSAQQPDYGSRSSQTHYNLPAPTYTAFASQPSYPAATTSTAHPASYTRPAASEQPEILAHPHSPVYPARQNEGLTFMSRSPSMGSVGQLFTVVVKSEADLIAEGRTFNMHFGQSQSKATLSRRDSHDYSITADIPYNASGSEVDVQVNMQSADGHLIETLNVGSFQYEEAKHISYSPTLESKKRKFSVDEEQLSGSVKRVMRQPIAPRPKSSDYGHNYQPFSGGDSHYSINTETPRTYGDYSYGHSSDTSNFAPRPLPRQYSYPYSSPETPQHHMPTTSQTWSHSHSSPSTIGALSSRTTMHSAVHDNLTPTLVRTSSLQISQGSPNGREFNPYSIGYTAAHKAVLNLEGDLGGEGLLHTWHADERDARRKLIRFYREQKGNTINARFQAVNPNEKHPDAIIVSCILWEERGEAYVTSVDCISLLESLIGVKFTVEEKNRIRRNLEGFRPLTVSKAKHDSEEFFKLIMSFPPPKPRNIEKDVKVFPWSVLPLALKKIIDKYSASYATTASVIPQTAATGGSSYADHISDRSHRNSITTMAPLSAPATITTHAVAAASAAGSASNVHSSLGIHRSGHSLAPAAPIWESSISSVPHSLPPPVSLHRHSWDQMNSYVDSPASAPHMSNQAVYYQRAVTSLDDHESLSAGTIAPTHHLPQM